MKNGVDNHYITTKILTGKKKILRPVYMLHTCIKTELKYIKTVQIVIEILVLFPCEKKKYCNGACVHTPYKQVYI